MSTVHPKLIESLVEQTPRAMIDGLTNIYNRRFFLRYLKI